MDKRIVPRIGPAADLRPHRSALYMASNDPDFETKAAHIIGLHLDPPRHAGVLCIDEKTAVQAFDRVYRVLPLSPGRVERHAFDYKRHGTLSLYAALNVPTSEAQGKTTARHTAVDFLGVLVDVVATLAQDKEIHVLLDNLSTHKTKPLEGFLDEHPYVRLHFNVDVLVLVESGRALVLERPTARPVAGHLHVDGGPGAEAATPHRHRLEACEALPLEVCQRRTTHHS
ncbi:MAG: transposase [Gammaproteobacteria bacterium]|nr:transposase [Gammaproteobacteria bacterium]